MTVSICLELVTVTMTGSDDMHQLPVTHLLGAVLGVLKPANRHAPVVLLIFQHSPASQAALFVFMKTSCDTSTDSSRLLVSSTVGF